MATSKPTDLIIIGAGPAGISTALHLIQDDPSWAERMILLEKEAHPRSKLCGGGITRSGLQILQNLGFPLPLPLEQSRVDNIYLKFKNRVIHVRGKPMFVVINRPNFDHYLARNATTRGIRILENAPVQSCLWEKDLVTVNSTKGAYRAKTVAIADGSSGIISRVIRGRKPKKRKARAIEYWSSAAPSSTRFSQQSAVFDFTFLSKGIQGYWWEFPSIINNNMGHNRGVYDAQLAKISTRIKLTKILNRAKDLFEPKVMSQPIKGASIHCFSPSTRISASRTILVGDAAGADVLFGEGISPALGFGKIAAESINKAFNDQNFGFACYKRKVLFSNLGWYLLIRRILASYTYHLGDHDFFTHLLWTAGQFLATIWRGKPLY
jgi:flavin-dependent dehydrogenase